MDLSQEEEIFSEYLTECKEHLEEMELLVDKLKDPTAVTSEEINTVLRGFHSIKGGAGFLGLSKIRDLSHSLESLMVGIRDGKIKHQAEMSSTLIKGLDKIRKLIQDIKNQDIDISIEVADIEKWFDSLHSEETEKTKVRVVNKENKTVKSEPQETKLEEKVIKSESLTDETIRIKLSLVDTIMNLVGELVLTRNRLMDVFSETKFTKENLLLKEFDFLVTNLHHSILKSRMQPLSNLFRKIPGIVREISGALGKEVEVQIAGEGIELDKVVLEGLSDPMTHILRNTLDHGIETAEERIKLGKSEKGKITISAVQKEDMIQIEVTDDGRGLSVEKIKKKIIEKNIRSESELDSLGENQIFNFILLPGFSTKDEVSAVSGRGVGMDVIQKNLSNLGGGVRITSKEGEGTRITMEVPLTVAIIPALTVSCKGARYAIPHTAINEVILFKEDEAIQKIDELAGFLVLKLRDQLIPIIPLVSVILPEKSKDPISFLRQPEISIVIVKSGQSEYGLIVDEIQRSQEVVVKQIPNFFKHSDYFSGVTIFENGMPGMILDVNGIATRQGLSMERISPPVKKQDGIEIASNKEVMILIFKGCESELIAVRLSKVHRIEKIEAKKLQSIGKRKFLQYKESKVEVVFLDDLIAISPINRQAQSYYMIVIKKGAIYKGVLTEKLEDLQQVEADSIPVLQGTTQKTDQVFIKGKMATLINIERLLGFDESVQGIST